MQDLHNAKYDGAIAALDYLIGVACEAEGLGAVWRALFAAERASLVELKRSGQPFEAYTASSRVYPKMGAK